MSNNNSTRRTINLSDIGKKSVDSSVETVTKKTVKTTDKDGDTVTQTVTESITEPTELKDHVTNQFCSPELWIFILSSIIVLVLCFLVAYSSLDWYEELNKWNWISNYIVIAIILVIVFIVMAYGAFVSYAASGGHGKHATLIVYLVVILASFAWFVVLFTYKDLEGAFNLSMLLLLFTIILTVMVFENAGSIGWCVVPFLIFNVFMIGATWNIKEMNEMS
uniref:Transmembrane protein n=1 Tax=viral metagenome TaxID=1070528 RepID=A0A6C0AEJ8_9ZZZZ